MTIPDQIVKEAKIKLGDELCVDLSNNQITMRLCKK
ncbi:MAG: hypothetical protein KGI08_09035 [Thaumarchaeota archaeon]|nr:hypothetical protein [Nitrososphaerota archaeon]